MENKMKNRKVMFTIMGIIILLYPIFGIGKDYYFGKIPYGYITNTVLDVMSEEGIVPIGEIIDGRRIRQHVIFDTHGIKAIKLFGATYARQNQGMLTVNLLEVKSNDILESWNIDVSNMKDNAYFDLNIKNGSNDLFGKECLLEIFSKGAYIGNAVTLYACKNDVYPDGYLELDGKVQVEDICFQIDGITETRGYLHTKISLRLYIVILFEVTLYLVYKNEKLKRQME